MEERLRGQAVCPCRLRFVMFERGSATILEEPSLAGTRLPDDFAGPPLRNPEFPPQRHHGAAAEFGGQNFSRTTCLSIKMSRH